jgi:glutamate/tyrosine decarboxylase-like PLP-dependent enzyme
MLGRDAFRELGYHLIELAAEHLYQVRERPPYRPVPQEDRLVLVQQPLPQDGVPAQEIVALFEERVRPYPTFGTGHPRGFGWITGGPDPMAVLGSLLGAALNPNCVGGDQSATYLELAVLRWLKELVGFPTEDSAGLLVSGGTMALLICLMAARQVAAEKVGWDPRKRGMQQPLVVYASEQAHHCVQAAVEVLGLGHASLRIVSTTDDFRMDVSALRAAIRRDRAAGLLPCCVVGNAGSTNTGAIDPLAMIADLCEEEQLWFHVDGSYGAFGRLDPEIAPRLSGMERAHSLSLDPHKWLAVPYECGCALVRDRRHLEATFGASMPDYLYETLGEHPFAHLSFQLSRGFHALKLWMTLLAAGRSGVARLVQRHNALARSLARWLDEAADFERLSPVELSTVCFRFAPAALRDEEEALDRLNKAVMRAVRRGGEACVSGTTLCGRFVLRACIVHADSTEEDLRALLETIRRTGGPLAARVSGLRNVGA